MHRSTDRSRSSEGRNSVSEELPEIYAGPIDFIEVGARGFLVSTMAKKEEFGIDDAVELLRQTSIKLYGGYKPAGQNSKDLERKGYVKIACLDNDAIKVHPHPGGEEDEGADLDNPEAPKNEEENSNSTKTDVNGTEISQDAEDHAKEEKSQHETGEDKGGKPSEKEDEESKDDKSSEKGDGESKDDKSSEKEKESKKQRHDSKKAEEEEKRKDSAVLRMHSIYKFVAYRTEMRNIFFIKSDVPDPNELAEAAMELVLERKSVTGDAVCQLLPVLGVCQYDYQQLEIMCRRILSSVFSDTYEPKSFAVMLIDKLSEPGAEVVYETVRNAVWAANPLAWMSSPISEPDIVIRFELIGSKLVLSCLRRYMSYRQYSPTGLVEMGKGEPEDDDGGAVSEEIKRHQEKKKLEKERQKEQERLKELERQKERAKKAEAKRKAREEDRKKSDEDRKERREREKQKSSGKSKSSEKSEKSESSKKDKGPEDESQSKGNADEGTPPSKRQRTDSQEGDGTDDGEGLETSATEETPPSKKQRVDTSTEDLSKDEEELLLADDSNDEQEKEAEEEQEEDRPKKSKTRRGCRGGSRKNRGKALKK